MTIRANGHLIFTDGKQNGLFELDPDTSEVKPIVPGQPKLRFADFDVHPTSPQWIISVLEDHTLSHDQPKNSIVAVESSTSEVREIRSGADFYHHPRFSPDGSQICWNEWNHPHMPWRETTLFIADWTDGKIENAKKIAGGAGKMNSICQPRWGIDGSLFFADDRTGFYQLYRLRPGKAQVEMIHLKGLEGFDFAGRESRLGRYAKVICLGPLLLLTDSVARISL